MTLTATLASPLPPPRRLAASLAHLLAPHARTVPSMIVNLYPACCLCCLLPEGGFMMCILILAGGVANFIGANDARGDRAPVV